MHERHIEKAAKSWLDDCVEATDDCLLGDVQS